MASYRIPITHAFDCLYHVGQLSVLTDIDVAVGEGIAQNGLYYLPSFDYETRFVVCRSPDIFSLSFSYNWSATPSDVCSPVPLS